MKYTMFNNIGLKVMATLLFSSMVVLMGGGRYAYADFDYSEYHYKTYNNLKENIENKDKYLKEAFATDVEVAHNKNVLANQYILELEKIAAEANGLKIGSYTKAGDYKKIVQPIIISFGSNRSGNFGNYQIVLGDESLQTQAYYHYGDEQYIREPQTDARIIFLISHEIGHGVLNHGTCRGDKCVIRDENQERDADTIAWRTLEKTSDFGWGYALKVDMAYRLDYWHEDYFEKQTNNKLRIEGDPIKYNNRYMLNINGNWYDARKLFKILIGSKYQFDYAEDTYNAYAMSLGQLGYIYSKEKKIDTNKIFIVPETKYQYLKSKLIYKSSNMPNGYKTIAFFSSSVSELSSFWNKSQYTKKEGYHYKDAYNDLAELKMDDKDSVLVADKALMIAIKYAGINIFNDINYFH